jgi:hypothetical protein
VKTDAALTQVFDWFKENNGTNMRPYALTNVPG